MPLSNNRIKELLNYKFVGVDESFLYYHCQIKYWDRILNYIPMWVSPNAITLTGFIAMVIQTGIVWYLDSGLTGSIKCLPAVSAAFMWFYSTLDCLDGMQARRTGAKSPLGQLFDHGVDSIVCTLIIYCASSAIGLQKKRSVFFLLLCAQAVFYWVTTKEYYTGVFYLGFIGPTESIALGCIFFLLLSTVGKDRLLHFHPWIKKNFSLIIECICTFFWLVVTMYYLVYIELKTEFKTQATLVLPEGIRTFPHILFIGSQILTAISLLNTSFIENNIVFYFYLAITTMEFSLFSIWTIFSHQLSMPIYIPARFMMLPLIANLVLVFATSKRASILISMIGTLAFIEYFLTTRDIIGKCLKVLGIPFFFNNYKAS
ncbi:ethanolaminephosphotransferase [Nematocida ausubeli]|nr:ethanolaminephosphotransferase [Nematocida ausubeli]KAI5162898.1 ethanolaminephosphotransferase [Nematocida ausubeli]